MGALTDHVGNSAGTVALGHQIDVTHHPTWPSVLLRGNSRRPMFKYSQLGLVPA